MGGTRHIVSLLIASTLAACLPQLQLAQPAQPEPQPVPQQQQQQQPAPPQQPVAAVAETPQAAPGQSPPVQPVPQPYPPPAPQPYPPPAPQPYPPPAPYPAPGFTSYPSPPLQSSGRSHLHDGEVIADFATVGALTSIDILAKQDITNGNAVTLILLAGLAGGGGTGYLLTQKYEIEPGSAHATTIGLLVGLANGALLIEPSNTNSGPVVLSLLLAGSAVGTVGGFVYGQSAHLTAGQATFLGNMTMLGAATAGLGAIAGSTNTTFGAWQDGTLALGLDGGLVAGAALAPRLDWSAHRANTVLASTFIGAMGGALVAGLLAKPDTGTNSTNNDLIAAAMTAGLWGGFGLGVIMTKDAAPDPKYAQTHTAVPPSTTFMPWVGHEGQIGMMAGGFF